MEKKTQTNEQIWVCDALEITHCEVNDDAVIYTVTYVDFMGLKREVKLNREECYFDFPAVLKTLVKGGYRYNTMLAQAPAVIQQRLTAYRPNVEAVKKAIEEAQKQA